MTADLDNAYLPWLYGQVGEVKNHNSSKSYWNLLRQMYSKEFVWFIPNDDNRVEDGKYLRHEWAEETGQAHPDRDWMRLPCSFLELLIALSRRLAFEADGGDSPAWFWHLIDNLGLRGCHDRSRYDTKEVEEALDTVIFRTYDPDGRGGLFPLVMAHQDQREVEIWYQLNAYLLQGE